MRRNTNTHIETDTHKKKNNNKDRVKSQRLQQSDGRKIKPKQTEAYQAKVRFAILIGVWGGNDAAIISSKHHHAELVGK